MDVSGGEQPRTAPKVGTWSAMNWIQRSGVIGLAPCFVLSLVCNGRTSMFFGLLGWTSIFLGYVAGNLWRFRHALHFWLSLGVACIVHIALLPTYGKLVHQIKYAPSHDGKGYMYLAFGLLIAEVLILLFVLKRVAMWIHHHVQVIPSADDKELRPHGR